MVAGRGIVPHMLRFAPKGEEKTVLFAKDGGKPEVFIDTIHGKWYTDPCATRRENGLLHRRFCGGVE